jgi:hypothetical protein
VRWLGAASAALALCVCGCGGSSRHGGARAASQPSGAGGAAGQARGPALGLTEDNADLLWNPLAPARTGGAAFQPARVGLTALHPRYLRLLIDWAALQPHADGAAALAASVDGCARLSGPCAAYGGVRAELAAIASQQRADPGAFEVVVDVLGAPTWAARTPSGCEPPGTGPIARPLRPKAIAAYRALIASLLALARSEGVALEWWSPWNEPNDARFLSPQRAACRAGAPALAPAIYAQLASAMAAELEASGARHHLLLGELKDVRADSPDSTSVASFIAALPGDVLCLAGAWSIHDYALQLGRASFRPDAATALERALDSRAGCARGAVVWVTEAGAGAPHPGRPRPPGRADEISGCLALARQLRRWYADPRVGAVFQYSFREDPAYPVGLFSADLAHVYPTYELWLQYARLRAAGLPPPAPAAGCT